MSHEKITQQLSQSLEIEQSLYEKLNELEKQIKDVGADDSIKEKLKYTKIKINEMEEKEVIFSIRLAEAEKNWMTLFKGEDRTTGESDKNFTENLDAKQFYKEKYDQINQEMKKIGDDYTKLKSQIENLKSANDDLSKLNEQLTNEVHKLHGGGIDGDENEMKNAIAELTEKNIKLMNQNNDLLSKYHEIISEHEKCKYILEEANGRAMSTNNNTDYSSLKVEYEKLKNENERLHLLREKIENDLKYYYDNKNLEGKDAQILGGEIVKDVIRSAEEKANTDRKPTKGLSKDSSKVQFNECTDSILSKKSASKSSFDKESGADSEKLKDRGIELQSSKTKISEKSLTNFSIEGTQKDIISATSIKRLSFDDTLNASTTALKGSQYPSSDQINANASKTSKMSIPQRSKSSIRSQEKSKASLSSVNRGECSCQSSASEAQSKKSSISDKIDEFIPEQDKSKKLENEKTSKTSVLSKKLENEKTSKTSVLSKKLEGDKTSRTSVLSKKPEDGNSSKTSVLSKKLEDDKTSRTSMLSKKLGDGKTSKTSVLSKKESSEKGWSKTPSKTPSASSKMSAASQKTPSEVSSAKNVPKSNDSSINTFSEKAPFSSTLVRTPLDVLKNKTACEKDKATSSTLAKSNDSKMRSGDSQNMFEKPSESKLSVLSEPTSSSSDDMSPERETPKTHKVWDSNSIDKLVDRHLRTKMKEDILEMFKDIAKYKNEKSGKCSNCRLLELLTTPSQKDVGSKGSLRK